MGKTSRKYKGARTPQSLKEVRASARRGAVQQPKRTEAKSRVTSAVAILTGKKSGDATAAAETAAVASPDFLPVRMATALVTRLFASVRFGC